MATVAAPVRIVPRGFGRTARRDAWWVQPIAVFLGLSAFIVAYALRFHSGLIPITKGVPPLWQYINELRRKHEITICLTTHQLIEAEDADRICILDHGHVVARGSPREVKSQLVHEQLIIDAADRDVLRRRLQQMKVSFTERDHFVVSLDGLTAYEVVHGINEPLTTLRTESPSLEDAYLRILAGGDA